MTIDPERLRAIDMARDFLRQIHGDKAMKVSDLRNKAYWILRHYPEDYWVADLRKWMETAEAHNAPLTGKIDAIVLGGNRKSRSEIAEIMEKFSQIKGSVKMSDIRCKDKECQLRKHCHRFKAKPSLQQSYLHPSPRIGDVCEYFWEIIKERRKK